MKIWTEISKERLAKNFAALQRLLSEGQGLKEADTALLAVVKANAYGHGIVPCAAVLARAGAEWLGVTDAREGARVRAAVRRGLEPTSHIRDVQRPVSSPETTELLSQNRDTRQSDFLPRILVMSGTVGLAGEAECIARNGLTAVIWEAAHLVRLTEAAVAAASIEPLRVHLEVDSGMSRQGAAPGAELDTVLQALKAEPRVLLDGVFTHFASTEIAGSAQTAAQQRCFEDAIAQVAVSGLRPRWVHVGNSSYIDNADSAVEKAAIDCGNAVREQGSIAWLDTLAKELGARAMVRSGLALYGYLLPIEGPGDSLAGSEVSPIMTWKTRVIGVREVPAGASVGYNGTFVADRAMRLALLPVGYADGLRRELSSTNAKTGGWVMIRGEQAPIVGRVSMNLTTVDVSAIVGVAEGDEAVLLGDRVRADDHARLAGTIPYEILCGIRTSR